MSKKLPFSPEKDENFLAMKKKNEIEKERILETGAEREEIKALSRVLNSSISSLSRGGNRLEFFAPFENEGEGRFSIDLPSLERAKEIQRILEREFLEFGFLSAGFLDEFEEEGIERISLPPKRKESLEEKFRISPVPGTSKWFSSVPIPLESEGSGGEVFGIVFGREFLGAVREFLKIDGFLESSFLEEIEAEVFDSEGEMAEFGPPRNR